jgi:hypothetical protein
VRRYLHRHACHASVHERPQHTLQLDRARRREAAATRLRRAFAADEDTERSDRGASAARRIVEQMTQHPDGRRLAVRACDADELEVRAGFPVRSGSGNRGSTPRIGHDERRQRGTRRVFDDGGRGAIRDGGKKVVPIARGPANRDEQRPRAHLPTVVGDAGELVRHRSANIDQDSSPYQGSLHARRRECGHRGW